MLKTERTKVVVHYKDNRNDRWHGELQGTEVCGGLALCTPVLI